MLSGAQVYNRNLFDVETKRDWSVYQVDKQRGPNSGGGGGGGGCKLKIV